jgi:hypothetical protein
MLMKSAPPPEHNPVAQWVIDEHRELLATLRGVETIVEASTAPASGDVARQLEQLAEQFARHTEQEEKTPLYRDYPDQYPSHRAALEGLLHDHGSLDAELRALAAEAAKAPSVGLETTLSTRIRAALAELRRHEAAEASLVQELGD